MADRRNQETSTPAPNEAEVRLLESTLALFAERGFAATTIREIIEQAQVTRPVLYYYFENKEQLFVRLITTWFEQIGQRVDRVLDARMPLAECLLALANSSFEGADQNPAAVRLTLQAFFAPRGEGPLVEVTTLWERRFGRIVQRMQEGLDSGEIGGADAVTLARTFLAMIDMHILAKTHRPELDLSKGLAETIVRIFLHGTATPTPVAGKRKAAVR